MRGPRYLIIISEDTIIAHFQFGYAGLFLFRLKQFLKFLFAMFHQIQKLVQIGMIAVLEQSPVGDYRRRAVNQGGAQQGGRNLRGGPRS